MRTDEVEAFRLVGTLRLECQIWLPACARYSTVLVLFVRSTPMNKSQIPENWRFTGFSDSEHKKTESRAVGFPSIDFPIESWHFSAITTGRYINGNGHYQHHPPVVRRDHSSYIDVCCFVTRGVQ